LKCQKNGTVVEKIHLGQAEEDSDRLMKMKNRCGRIRSRDVMRTYWSLIDSDVNDLVRRSELRHSRGVFG
jgi:hypothetical protein